VSARAEDSNPPRMRVSLSRSRPRAVRCILPALSGGPALGDVGGLSVASAHSLSSPRAALSRAGALLQPLAAAGRGLAMPSGVRPCYQGSPARISCCSAQYSNSTSSAAAARCFLMRARSLTSDSVHALPTWPVPFRCTSVLLVLLLVCFLPCEPPAMAHGPCQGCAGFAAQRTLYMGVRHAMIRSRKKQNAARPLRPEPAEYLPARFLSAGV